jgi:hypothetical protein
LSTERRSRDEISEAAHSNVRRARQRAEATIKGTIQGGVRTRGEKQIMKISRILTGLLPALALLFTMSRPVVRAADDVPAVGAVAPDFTLSSQEGKKVSLHD